MFRRILIANRGEIACRVMRTCRRMGIGAVAVHSSADRGSPHVAMADEAVRIGAAPAALSYLDGSAIVEAARRTGAEAVHPGYGFLSENPDFAAACTAAGLVFVGPPVGTMRAVASKGEAKRVMRAAGVPVLGGGPDGAPDDAALAAAARETGFPVMVKPVAGGGGRGLRVVRDEAGLGPALAAARREAAASFGDDRLMVEPLLERVRHVEVQVFGDAEGRVVHLHERDCSVQRRHQKVVEEAPAPHLPAATRERLADAAVAAARAVGYRGAGTVEFLVGPDGGFRFIEMNARLQVEHPVTEMITGLDLVEWQIRVAAGEALPRRQEDIPCRGHAAEARLCAEDPADGFRPGFGRLHRLALPEPDAGLRVDSGVAEGGEVSVHYDSMIAKIAALGGDRAAALGRLSSALASVRVAGPATNERFLKAIVDHPEFRAGGCDTGFVDRRLAELAAPQPEPTEAVAALAAFAALSPRASPPDRSPWSDRGAWRLGGRAGRRIRLVAGERPRDFVLRPDGGLADGDGRSVAAGGRWAGDAFAATVSGVSVEAEVVRAGAEIAVFADGCRHLFVIDDPLLARRGGRAGGGALAAPMPGVVSAVHAAAGDRVRAGDVLMVIEAMKVEHPVRAPVDGEVTAVRFGPGDRVREGQELVDLAGS